LPLILEGVNYVLRRFWWLGVIGALALLLMGYSLVQIATLRAAGATEAELHGTVLDNPPLVNGIELTSSEGERASLADFEGKVVLAFFGFTNCPDVCPLTMGRLARIYRDLGEPEDVQVVMITVDPEHDTPEVLREYLARFHPDFVGLTGTPAEIANATRAFFIGYRDLQDQGFIHTDTVAMLDRTGRMRLVYGQDKILAIEDDLRRVLADRTW
jgi:protein SCO1/2